MNKTFSIRVLPREVSEKIAAGEVVERPLSVVKELVENSIDAGSTQVSVELEDGGTKLIRVIDNGCGMTREEMELAVLRFATSKIQKFEDLENLQTLGFRGEALPSIGAVSHLEIVSCPHKAYLGHRLIIEGGTIKEIIEAAPEAGTCITVRELFFNTPARKKFLKSPVSEASQISHYLAKMALAYRTIHFKLKSNGKNIFNFPPQLSRKDCLVKLWQLDDENDLYRISTSNDRTGIEGYLCHPRITRGNRSEQFIFVNGRLIRNNLISQAIQEGFQPFILPKRYPLALLFLHIFPDELDVNVHPTKTEIRFADNNEVFRVVKDAVAKTVREFQVPIYPIVKDQTKDSFKATEVYETPLLYNRYTGEVIDDVRTYSPEIGTKLTSYGIPSSWTKVINFFLPLIQLHNTYIIGEMEGELWIVDQHASHERVIYERLARSLNEHSKISQGLLFSEVLEYSPSESILLEQNLDIFREMGILIEHFSGNSFVLKSLPSFFKSDQAGNFIRNILTDYSIGKGKYGDDLYENLRKIVACKASIQAGQKMTPEEMKKLISDLMKSEDPYHCPHGRPTIVKLNKFDMEKLFKRK